MIYLLAFLSFIMAVFLSSLIIPRILLVAFRKRLFDIPDDRKNHLGAIPRLGGISFVPTLFFTMAFFMAIFSRFGCGVSHEVLKNFLPYIFMLVCGLVLLFLIGIADDLIGVRYRQKFIVQIIVGIFFPLSGLWINNLYGLLGVYGLSPWLGMPITVFVVVFITNAINLIDGIDGLASGLSSAACCILGCLFLYSGAWLYAILAFITLGMLIPFFYYNVFGRVERGRKIFMGDTGSLTLGLVLSFLVISYVMYEPAIKPFTEGAIVVAFSTLVVPMFDVVRVVMLRLRQHKHPFKPDRNHIHHKFLDMGVLHHTAMIFIVLLSVLFSVLNILSVKYIQINIILLLDIIIWVGLNLWFDRIRDRRFS